MAAVKREDHAEHLHEPARTVDPHAWQSLDNGIIYAQNIAAGLAQADPANAPDYYARAKAYMGKMKALNIRIKSQFEAIAASRRKVVTYDRKSTRLNSRH